MNNTSEKDSALCAMLSVLVDNASDGVIVLDYDYRVCIWNLWMVQHSTILSDAILHRPLFECIPGLNNKRLKQAIDDALENGMASYLSHTLSKDPFPLVKPGITGEKIKQKISIKSVDARHGERYCYIHISDVTASVKREYFLRELVANAQMAQK
ncbi:MAG TPA: hypothetical protein ENK06_11620, partial [Gammaproteobacteria bacterium]|nr:hypothetical protein [Gammaproteobacteria bacterium]